MVIDVTMISQYANPYITVQGYKLKLCDSSSVNESVITEYNMYLYELYSFSPKSYRHRINAVSDCLCCSDVMSNLKALIDRCVE